MTDNQISVLLALNLRQMQWARVDWEALRIHGVETTEIATVAGLSVRATAAVLARARSRGWVQSYHSGDETGWLLIAGGVQALEAERGRIRA